MTDEAAKHYADMLGINLKEFRAAYYTKLAQVDYLDAMNRSPQEIVMAIFDKMGVKFNFPIADY